MIIDFMDIDEFEEYEDDEGEFGSHSSGDQSQISVVQRSMTYQTMDGNEGYGKSGIASDMRQGATEEQAAEPNQAWPYASQGVNIESSEPKGKDRHGQSITQRYRQSNTENDR